MIDHQVGLKTPPALTSSTNAHLHFPGLNTLRFYAALAVIVEHVGIQLPPDQILFKFISPFFLSAQNAVNLFFVLSGFLITYLLLEEKVATGTIHVKNFYIKRALRIWPLYYWVTLLGLVIFPILLGPGYPLHNLPVSKLILAFGLLPNFASITAPMIHLWSIGVEEQFYAAWPWANKSERTMLQVCFGILIIKLFLTPIVASFHDEKTLTMFYSLRFECMAIGALGAYIYSRGLRYLAWIYHPWIQVTAIGAFIYLTVFDPPINTYNNVWSSVVHIMLIINVATNQHSLVKLNIPLFEKFGEISYGMYLYHFPVLYLIYVTAHKNGFISLWTSPFLLLLCTLGSTLIIAFISYRWFEAPFLNLKKKFAVAPISSKVSKKLFT